MYDITNNFCHKILFVKTYFPFCVKDERKHPLQTYMYHRYGVTRFPTNNGNTINIWYDTSMASTAYIMLLCNNLVFQSSAATGVHVY